MGGVGTQVALLRVRTLGDPILRSASAPVATFDDEFESFIQDMFDTMDDAPGVGLAAPQVGRAVRAFVYDARDEDEPARGAMINPTIVWMSEDTEEMEEGCLSIPDTYFPVERARAVRVEAVDLRGAPITAAAEGFLARIFQHEIDHLAGVLFIDRLAPELRKEAMRMLRDQDFGMAPPPRPRRAL